MATIGISSWGQGSKLLQDTIDKKTSNSTKIVQHQKSLTNHNEEFIDTKYEYSDSDGSRLIIT
jgi:hypothetical protein